MSIKTLTVWQYHKLELYVGEYAFLLRIKPLDLKFVRKKKDIKIDNNIPLETFIEKLRSIQQKILTKEYFILLKNNHPCNSLSQQK